MGRRTGQNGTRNPSGGVGLFRSGVALLKKTPGRGQNGAGMWWTKKPEGDLEWAVTDALVLMTQPVANVAVPLPVDDMWGQVDDAVDDRTTGPVGDAVKKWMRDAAR